MHNSELKMKLFKTTPFWIIFVATKIILFYNLHLSVKECYQKIHITINLHAASVEEIISSFEGLSLNTSRSASILLISSGSLLKKHNNIMPKAQ